VLMKEATPFSGGARERAREQGEKLRPGAKTTKPKLF
jgi:hypothetical protein